MEFSYKNFEDEFADSMIELEKAFQERDHLKTISYLRFLSRAYYEINYKLSDNRLEEITQQISLDLLGEALITNSEENTVVFYDNFGHPDRGLADIYIRALDKMGYQVVWIMHINAVDAGAIQRRYVGNKNISFRIVPMSPILDRMRILQTYIKEIAPRHMFIYGYPFDVCGAGVFSTVKGNVTRYLIEMGDHAFWLGKCAVDFFIGFRNWSYNVEKQLRGISPEQLIILPFYPNSRAQYPYEGMPFDEEKHEFIFSGGSLYKIEGDSTYQEMVEYILTNYPEMKFVFAGTGTIPILEHLKGKYGGQFFHIDERKDLDGVFKHAKLYLGTYPVCGGLMTQYAVMNHCVPLCLEKEPGSIMDPSTFLLQPDKADFVFESKEALLTELDKLLDNEQHLKQARSKLTGQVISEEEFVEELQRVLTEHQTRFTGQDIHINLDCFLAVYRKRADYNMFCHIIYNSHNDWVKRKYPEIIEKIDAKNQNRIL